MQRYVGASPSLGSPEDPYDEISIPVGLYIVGDSVFAQLIKFGAQENEPLTERGVGFATASVIDLFELFLG